MFRGGSRPGAGRPGWHAKTNSASRLDVRELQRRGAFAYPGSFVSISWGLRGNGCLNVNRNMLTVSLHWPEGPLDGQRVVAHVRLERTPCTFGGSQVWFACPDCTRRAALLYLHERLTCRRCAGFVYPSQSLDSVGRSWERTRKIDRQLGPPCVGSDGRQKRPKGMRSRTFEELMDAGAREMQWRWESAEAAVDGSHRREAAELQRLATLHALGNAH